MRKLPKTAIFAVCVAACAPSPPASVGVFVQTVPPNAACTVSRNGNPIGHIDQTPAIVPVPNEEADYLVTCARSAFHDETAVTHVRADQPSFIEYIGAKYLHAAAGASVTIVLTPKISAWPEISRSAP